MNIVILDGYRENPGDLSWDALKEFGSLTVYDRTPAEDVAQRIGTAAIAISNKTPITRATMNACPNLRYIAMLATGYDVVDIEAAREKGIVVANVPTYGTEAVAQFAIALLLEAASRVGHHDRAVKEGRWTSGPDWCFWDYPLLELHGKTMAIIGFGRIGQTTGRIAKAMGMRVLAVDEHVTEAGQAMADHVPLEQALAEADVISLHCNLTPATQDLIRKETIALMKDGAIAINNARGGLIVEQDLADALNTGKLAAAAVDVVSREPIRESNPLLHAKNCIITPHISWSPQACRQRIMDVTVRNVRTFLEGKPENVVF